MQLLRKRLLGTAFLIVLALAVASPASAQDGLFNPGTDGGSKGGAIWVTAGITGSAKRSYPSCPWQPGWPNPGSGNKVVDPVDPKVAELMDYWGYPYSFGPQDEATVVMRPATPADLDPSAPVDTEWDGEIDSRVTQDGYVIEEATGLSWVDEIVAPSNMLDVGVFQPSPLNGSDPANLTPQQLSGQHYKQSGFYPMIQRGTDPVDGTELWWDPWFVAPEDMTANCPAGLIYSPRFGNPSILLPDLRSFVTRLLPPVRPAVIPVDQKDGWAYVQVPTNFGVASSSLAPKSAHAEVGYITPGGNQVSIWAELQAVPVRLVFNPGDGSGIVVCNLSAMKYDPANPGPCSHTFLDSSNTAPGGAFRADVSVIWAGLYTDSTGASRVIDILPTRAPFNLRVAEARPSS